MLFTQAGSMLWYSFYRTVVLHNKINMVFYDNNNGYFVLSVVDAYILLSTAEK
jgi:hypothetical protein